MRFFNDIHEMKLTLHRNLNNIINLVSLVHVSISLSIYYDFCMLIKSKIVEEILIYQINTYQSITNMVLNLLLNMT